MTTRTHDIEEIQQALRHYADGVMQGKVELVRSLFHPQAVMSGYMDGHLILGSPAPFLNDVEHGPAQESLQHGYRCRLLSVDVFGATATAIFAEDRISVGLPDGSRKVMDIVDSFHFLKIDGCWQIVSKLFHHDPL